MGRNLESVDFFSVNNPCYGREWVRGVMRQDNYAAVFFCEQGKIVREMLYAEFEAILDSFVPMPEYAGQDIKAIYVEIGPSIKVVAAVYFTIGFDGAGNADRKWNVPLVQLAEQAEAGPNLGAGPIRLACRSQCPVSWHVQNMWDPNMNSEPNDFVLLRDVVKRNRLGFKKIEQDTETETETAPEPVPAAPQQQQQAVSVGLNFGEDISELDKTLAMSLVQFLRKKLDEENKSEREALAKKQHLLLAAQKTQFEDEMNKLQEAHSDELRQIQEQMQQYHQTLAEHKKQNEKLGKQLAEFEKDSAKSRQLFEQQLAKSKQMDSAQIELLKENLGVEMKRKIEAVTKELNDEIASKDMELAYRDEEKAALQQEIEQLTAEKAALIGQGGDQFLKRLKENNVSFVVYHQGAGHINIKIEDIGEYLGNPMAYAAKSCKVTEPVYRQWLVHHDNPVCQSFSETKGDVCGKRVPVIVSPSQFLPGRSDRCPLHWSFGEETGSKSRTDAKQKVPG